MFSTHAIKQDFGRAASAYDAQAHLQRQVRGYCIALAESYWKKEAHILDAGCGTGALAQEINWHVTGIDLAFGMCVEADKNIVNADAASMPFADESFDGIFSSLMLQWANDPLAILREMRRVAKPQGRCVISTLTQGTLQELRDSFGTSHVSAFLPAPDLLDFAAHAGFKIGLSEQATITEYYPDAMRLMQSLKNIGAGNKQISRSKGLMTPQQLSRGARIYRQRFATAQGLPATWQVLYMVLGKS